MSRPSVHGSIPCPVLVVVLLMLSAPAATGTQIRSSVVAGGGGRVGGSGVVLEGTLGQGPVGFASSLSHQHSVGFWYLVQGDVPTPVPLVGPTQSYRLDPNVPNPFNPVTTISFSLAVPGRAVLELFDVRGRLVARLLDAELPAGLHSIVLHANELASGVYVYRLRSGSYENSRRLTLIK